MRITTRRLAAAVSSVAVVAGTALAGLAIGAPSAFAGTNGTTTYEADCSGTGAAAGQTAPFISALTASATPDPSFPTGATFGVAGAYTGTLIGPLVAGLEANLVVSTIGLNVHSVTLGSTDGTATGSFAYSHTFAPVTANGRQLTGVTWTAASTTLSGPFLATDVGFSVLGSLSTTGIPAGAAITAVNPGVSATITVPTTAAQVTPGTVGLGGNMSFTDPGLSTGNVFTTNGVKGGKANIGIVSASSFDVVGPITLTFGGAPGYGTANCLETGWQSAILPGPAQSPAPVNTTGPLTPFGSTTNLVLASGGFIAQPGTTIKITPPAAAFVNLVDPAPVAQNGSVNLGVGGTKTITLVATDTDATPVASFAHGAPSNARLTVGPIAANGNVTITDTGVGPAIVTFTFTASDSATPPGVSNTATETVNIGTPPVDEPLTQQVNAGQLVLSCNPPESYLQPSNGNPVYTTNPGAPLDWTDFAGTVHHLASSPGATTANPELVCPEFQFPAITLNGLQQTTHGNGSTLYVSDNRGDPTVGWTLTASFVPTPSGPSNPNGNPNASCAGIDNFCNASVGAHALDVSGNGQIARANLSIGNIACAPHAGNLNPAAVAGAGGNFGSTQTICTAAAMVSGGTFDVSKTYTLVIPSSVYAGNYWGTVEYLVS